MTFSFVVGLRLKVSCDACTGAHVVDHATSEPSMSRKSSFHQNIVLMFPTSWYKNIRAICFTFSVVPEIRAHDARYPQIVHAKDLIPIST